MRAETTQLVRRLEDADWFCNLGRPEEDDVVVVHSWMDAIANCASAEWEDLTLEMSNQLSEQLSERFRTEYQQWNAIVGSAKALLLPLIQRKADRVVTANKLPAVFTDCIRWDMIGALVESEHEPLVHVGFFANLVTWYLRGHFPCGWEGTYPAGNLIVY